jgi:hypothetical protein
MAHGVAGRLTQAALKVLRNCTATSIENFDCRYHINK